MESKGVEPLLSACKADVLAAITNSPERRLLQIVTQSNWLRRWELNPLFLGYEPSVKPFHSSAINIQGAFLRYSIQLSYFEMHQKLDSNQQLTAYKAQNGLLLAPFLYYKQN